MNKVIFIDCDTEECVRRSVGRRIDPNNGNIYHLEDNPPNTNDQKLMERLKPFEEKEATEEDIREFNKYFDINYDKMEDLYSTLKLQVIMKDKKNDLINKPQDKITKNYLSKVSCLELPEATSDLNDSGISENFDKENKVKIDKTPKLNIKKEDQQITQISQVTKLKNKQQVQQEVAFIITKLIEQNDEKEQELIKQFQQKDNKENTLNDKTNILNLNPLNQKDRDRSVINNTRHLSGRFSKQLSYSLDEVSKRGEVVDNIEDDELNINIRFMKKINELKKRVDISITDNLLNKIKDINSSFNNDIKMIFNYINMQNDFIVKNLNKFQETFIKFITRPSNKKKFINEYRSYHNKIIVDDLIHYKKNPELQSKIIENMHIKIDHLNDTIWDIINKRKNESIKERAKIVDSGWIESEMEKLYMMIERLIFLEVDKFFKNLSLLREYYQILDNKVYIDYTNVKYDHYLLTNLLVFPLEKEKFTSNQYNSSDSSKTDFHKFSAKKFTNSHILNEYHYYNSESINNKANDQNNSNEIFVFPRMERLFKNCIYVLFKFEENITLQKEQQAQENIKKIVYKGKKNATAHHFSENNLDEKREYSLEEEFKHALKLEKQKLRYRFSRIIFWGENLLKLYRLSANKVFNILDDWIVKSVKEENEAMNTVIALCRQGLERESTIKIDEEMDCFNIYDCLNVKDFMQKQELKKHKKSSSLSMNIFSIEHLKSIYYEMKNNSIQPNYIYDTYFLDYYVKKLAFDIKPSIKNTLLDGIPVTLKKDYMDFSKYSAFISNISVNRIINLRYLFTILALIHVNVCPEDFVNKVYSALTEGRLRDISKPSVSNKDLTYQENTKTFSLLINNTRISREIYYKINFWFEYDRNPIYLMDATFKQELKDFIYFLFRTSDGFFLIRDFFEFARLQPTMNEVNGFQVIENKTYYELLIEMN